MRKNKKDSNVPTMVNKRQRTSLINLDQDQARNHYYYQDNNLDKVLDLDLDKVLDHDRILHIPKKDCNNTNTNASANASIDFDSYKDESDRLHTIIINNNIMIEKLQKTT